MTTRTEWLEQLRGADRVTLQDVVVTVQAFVPTPDEIAPYHAFLETLANELRAIVYPEPDGEATPSPASVAEPKSTKPTPEEVLS